MLKSNRSSKFIESKYQLRYSNIYLWQRFTISIDILNWWFFRYRLNSKLLKIIIEQERYGRWDGLKYWGNVLRNEYVYEIDDLSLFWALTKESWFIYGRSECNATKENHFWSGCADDHDDGWNGPSWKNVFKMIINNINDGRVKK